MSPDSKTISELLRLSPKGRRDISKWLGIPDRDMVMCETEIQHICRILIKAEQTDRIARMAQEIAKNVQPPKDTPVKDVLRNARSLLVAFGGDTTHMREAKAKKTGVDMVMHHTLKQIDTYLRRDL